MIYDNIIIIYFTTIAIILKIIDTNLSFVNNYVEKRRRKRKKSKQTLKWRLGLASAEDDNRSRPAEAKNSVTNVDW